MSKIFIDSFSSELDDMPRKDQGDPAKVLAVIKKHPRFSTFDASANNTIASTITYLFQNKLIVEKEPRVGYPWHEVKLTGYGESFLDIRNALKAEDHD